MRSCVLLATLLASPGLAQGIGLTELPALANARAERQRPEQLAALEPYLKDLQLERERSQEVVDEAIAKAAELGDGIVPLLLERLSPAQATPADLHLAANSARVLARLEPETFADALIDLARGEDQVARQHALELLGHVDEPRARETVAAVYPRLTDPADRRVALRAAERQRSPLLRDTAVLLLKDSDAAMRGTAASYLAAIADPAVRPAMLEAFRAERDVRLLDAYLDYFAAVAEDDAQVATALVEAIDTARLDGERLRRAVADLRTIAPEDHRETRRALRAILERGETGPLGIAAALTLEAIGDNRAERELFEQLEERVRRRRTDPDVYVDRAEAYIAFERWRDAIRDYELAIRHSASASRQGTYWLQIARCEAHRESSTRMLRALEQTGFGADTIRREARKDPVFEAMLEKDTVSRFLERLEK